MTFPNGSVCPLCGTWTPMGSGHVCSRQTAPPPSQPVTYQTPDAAEQEFRREVLRLLRAIDETLRLRLR